MKWFLPIWTAGFCGIPAILLVMGISQILSQKRKIDTFVSVDAVVLSTRVETVTSTDSDGHTSTSYMPVINYTYAVNGQKYQCDTAFPLGDISASADWADSLVRQFPKEKRVTAYYNPQQPSDAFLIRDLSYKPYMFSQFPMFFMLAGALVWTYLAGRWGGRKVKPPVLRDGGGFRLRPRRGLARRRRTLLAMTAFWYGLGVLTGGHYLAFATHYETEMYIMLPIFAAVGLIPAGLFTRSLLLSRTVAEPLVMTQSNQFRLGDEIAILVNLPIKTAVQINHLKVGLMCDRTTKTSSGGETTYATNNCYEAWATLTEDQQVHGGQRVKGTHAFTIPASQSPTNSKEYPMHDWYVTVRLDIAGSPDYRGRFPIVVEG